MNLPRYIQYLRQVHGYVCCATHPFTDGYDIEFSIGRSHSSWSWMYLSICLRVGRVAYKVGRYLRCKRVRDGVDSFDRLLLDHDEVYEDTPPLLPLNLTDSLSPCHDFEVQSLSPVPAVPALFLGSELRCVALRCFYRMHLTPSLSCLT